MASTEFVVAEMAGTPASVVFDIYEAANPGTILASVPNADIQQVGTTQGYQADLRAITATPTLGLPADGSLAEKQFILEWRDDSPSTFIQEVLVEGSRSSLRLDDSVLQPRIVYPSVPVPDRGITAQVMAQEKPSYVEWRVAPDGDFENPASVFFQVFHYDERGRTSKTVPSPTVPSP